MKKFSFVIPTYNSKVMLKYSLEALNNQLGYTSSDYEVILVDDGSVDDTWDYIKGTNRNYDLQYIYLEREPCSSRARARNFGWKSAQGEIVVFVDADIIVKPTHLSELDRLYTYEKDIVVQGTRLMLPKGAVIDFDNLFQIYNFNRKKLTLIDIAYFVYDFLSYNICTVRTPGILFSTCNSAVPRKYLEATNGFDENYIGWGIEDMDLGCRLHALKDVKFVVSSRLECLHQFHKHSANLSEELKRNRTIFENKYPNAAGNLPITSEIDIWNVLWIPDDEYLERFAGKQTKKKNKIVLEFRNREKFNQLKEDILQMSDREELDVEVYDYCEDTDLDIWITLLGVRKSTPKYFPVSRRIGKLLPEERSKFLSSLKEAQY
ncbi:glycosyltransferase family 2 protein [Ruminiclostridium cellobioparum]|uniref:Family 2 glycosyl transferase n=1 Tax=Ruminiclostridium cellobioparum subsp. termitidis CT1112 TaxID=1195236 RepID=S0FXC8_RUMCE|nr:glycosyltransferase family 2 protein [Ruminiclostridium cellobioparum]EMS73799.1 family 2 glycosyl transferase [Ruminiclostridium cellobioparum subsp. termitidis CT1112]